MRTKRGKQAACFIVLTCSILVAILGGGFAESHHPTVSVAFTGFTNSSLLDGKSLALITLRNNGVDSLRRHEFSTVYWTNASGVSQHKFVPLTPANTVILPGQSEIVAIALPPVEGAWNADFGFNIEPDLFQHVLGAVRSHVWFLSQGKPRASDQLFVIMGPQIRDVEKTNTIEKSVSRAPNNFLVHTSHYLQWVAQATRRPKNKRTTCRPHLMHRCEMKSDFSNI